MIISVGESIIKRGQVSPKLHNFPFRKKIAYSHRLLLGDPFRDCIHRLLGTKPDRTWAQGIALTYTTEASTTFKI